jgi:hypothetical protein
MVGSTCQSVALNCPSGQVWSNGSCGSVPPPSSIPATALPSGTVGATSMSNWCPSDFPYHVMDYAGARFCRR